MYLRKLKFSDALLMLEWMHDDSIVHDLHTDFANKNLADVEDFIRISQDTSKNLNLAIASDTDEYIGTVSLKHIDREQGIAEFAITVRRLALGQGYSWFGMGSIIQMAFNDLGLECVYWCVSKKNTRAIKFYEKHNFHEVYSVPNKILQRYAGIDNLRWYSVLKGDDLYIKDSIAGCKVIRIKTISTINNGELSYFEANNEIPFEIKRFYYISKVPNDVKRGFHAHKKLKQIIFCPFGKIKIFLENENRREEITLSDPSIGIVIDKPIWREMLWLQKDSVLCVAASDYYSADDYIHDYKEFKEYVRRKN